MKKTIESTGYVVKNGTKVKTIKKLQNTTGMIVNPIYLNTRKPSTNGVITGIVSGHGGEVYFVQHSDKLTAVYSQSELYLL